ncbi:hypothetical protein HGRIS_003194 [Hohenbuehelia grisea]|uniref:laccase n=1 Tax=Hohenbuehelia grisea TaxID=104357 RepID=A0ABR3JPW3_9AGAR
MSLYIWLVMALLAMPTMGITRSHTLKLENRVLNPDGHSRMAIVVNGQMPGPLISAKKHDTLDILVVNNLTDNTMARGTSIHWHGLFMHRSASQDGSAWVTQCPIASGDSYRYRFNVGNQTGTYWYHSHVTSQYCDGLMGPFVIYDDNDPSAHLYDVDDESTVLTLNDWFHDPTPKAFQLVQAPQAMLVNGIGRPWFGGNNLTVSTVKQGTRYRYRVINAACSSMAVFSIDNHSLQVIEIDGMAVKPYVANFVTLHPGQRVSFVLHANQPVGNYWIRTRASWEGVVVEYDDMAAILRYDGAATEDPSTQKQTKGISLPTELGLVPLDAPAQPPREPDIKINLKFEMIDDRFFVNGHSYVSPSLPMLLQILNGTSPHLLMPSKNIITLPRNKLVEVSLPGGTYLSPHPWHLHGHSFQVVRSANSSKYNYVNPPVRDVVSTGQRGDNVTIRFMTDNPGPWFLHCHIEFHLVTGLAVVFAEAPEEQLPQEKYSKEWLDLCPKWEKFASSRGKTLSESMLEEAKHIGATSTIEPEKASRVVLD